MIEPLWISGCGVQNSALYELVARGNYQKAATLAGALIKAHPVCETSIREDYGEEMSKLLLETNLLKLSSNLSQVK